MATQTIEPPIRSVEWTAADLVERFGPIPLWRICMDPAPGTATEDDFVRLTDAKEGLFELVDRVLVRKTMGDYESWLGVELARLIGNFAHERKFGALLGTDGSTHLSPELYRTPDVSFFGPERLRQRNYLRDSVFGSVPPDLVVEVISPSNTRREMERKLQDYFDHGVRLVWYVYPLKKQVVVYTGVATSRTLGEDETLEGGDVLPGFTLSLRELFARRFLEIETPDAPQGE
jgi:Uma2 family endonuclease